MLLDDIRKKTCESLLEYTELSWVTILLQSGSQYFGTSPRFRVRLTRLKSNET